MIGTAWISSIQGMTTRARCTSPPEASSIGGPVGREQAAVQHRRLARDDLGPQPCEVADVLVLPEEQRVEPGRLHLGPRSLDPLLAQLVGVGPVLVVDPELAVGEGAEVGAGGARRDGSSGGDSSTGAQLNSASP